MNTKEVYAMVTNGAVSKLAKSPHEITEIITSWLPREPLEVRQHTLGKWHVIGAKTWPELLRYRLI